MSLPATANPARPARAAGSTRQLRLLAPAAPLARDADQRRLERTRELATLERAVDRLAAGEGSVILLEATAGPRKTALLEYAARAATDAGCLVRRATPAPPERDLPYGVVRSLLEAPLRAATGPGRVSPLDGAAEPAAALLLGGVHADAEPDIVIAHSVLWLSAGLAAGRGLTLIVDDAHWSDAPSLTVAGLPRAAHRRRAGAARDRRASGHHLPGQLRRADCAAFRATRTRPRRACRPARRARVAGDRARDGHGLGLGRDGPRRTRGRCAPLHRVARRRLPPLRPHADHVRCGGRSAPSDRRPARPSARSGLRADARGGGLVRVGAGIAHGRARRCRATRDRGARACR